MEKVTGKSNTGYQYYDDFIDYDIFNFRGCFFRGPKPESDQYISCVGSAGTFGRFCEEPFPILIQKNMGVEVFNISSGGKSASNEVFTENIDIINKSKLCILQVMSARSESNSKFQTEGRFNGTNLDNGETQNAGEFWEFCLNNYNEAEIKQLIEETLHTYVMGYKHLIEKIKVPVVLLYIGHREPCDPLEYKTRVGIFRGFPQFINEPTINTLKGMTEHYAEYCGTLGYPQILPKMTLDGIIKNTYYPTPEQHGVIFNILKPIIKSII
jgi:hypothetical protein